jgi:hypothetical protein
MRVQCGRTWTRSIVKPKEDGRRGERRLPGDCPWGGGRADALVAGRLAGVAVPAPVRVIGGVVTAAGAVTLIGSFAQFAVEGQGTPAPRRRPSGW